MNVARQALYQLTIAKMITRGIPPSLLRPAEQWERVCKDAGVQLPLQSVKRQLAPV